VSEPTPKLRVDDCDLDGSPWPWTTELDDGAFLRFRDELQSMPEFLRTKWFEYSNLRAETHRTVGVTTSPHSTGTIPCSCSATANRSR
jgi:hypothetical protein